MLTVTIGVIAWNEEKYIENILQNIIMQDYNHALIDIILVDGMSSDKTKELMLEFASDNAGEFNRVVVVDNPKRVQPSAWNIVLDNVTTDLIIRIDAHSIIPQEFVTNSVRCIESGEDVCGGKRTNVIDDGTLKARILLAGENAMFGSGIARYRQTDKKEYAKSVAHACYKCEVFNKVGLFNEQLLRSEDNEMHYRIRKAGYKICLDPMIQSKYQTRATLGKMLKQKYGNGKWVGITSFLSFGIFSLYHYIPLLFLLGILGTTLCALCGLILPQVAAFFAVPSIVMWSAYLLLIGTMGAIMAVKNKCFVMLFTLPILFLLLHLSYGVGTFFGVMKGIFMRNKIRMK